VLGGSLVTLNPLALVTSSSSRFLKEFFFWNEITLGLGFLKDFKEPASFFKQLPKKGQFRVGYLTSSLSFLKFVENHGLGS
jgi:hypothetical protein